jgi:hypothetical protein
MLNYAAVLLVASVALGAEGRAKQDDFQKLRAFFGTWEARDIEAEGQEFRVPVSWQPALDGRFIEHRWSALDEAGEVVNEGLDMIGRDPSDQKVKFWEFDGEGSFSRLVLAKWEGQKSVWDLLTVKENGTERKAVVTFELLDKKSYKWAVKYEDGEELDATFKRVRQKKDLWPQPQLEMPEGVSEQLKEIDWWTGDFTTEGCDAFTGKTFVGQSNCGWTLDGKFLLYDIASVDDDLVVSRYRAVIGMDPATNKTTGWEFESTGTVGKYTVSDKGQDIVGKAMSPDAGVLEYKGRLTQTATGLEYQATGKLPEEKEVGYFGVWRKKESGEK